MPDLSTAHGSARRVARALPAGPHYVSVPVPVQTCTHTPCLKRQPSVPGCLLEGWYCVAWRLCGLLTRAAVLLCCVRQVLCADRVNRPMLGCQLVYWRHLPVRPQRALRRRGDPAHARPAAAPLLHSARAAAAG